MNKEVLSPDEVMFACRSVFPETRSLIATLSILSDETTRFAYSLTKNDGDEIFRVIAGAKHPYQDIASLMLEVTDEIVCLHLLGVSHLEVDHLLSNEEAKLPLLGSLRFGSIKNLRKSMGLEESSYPENPEIEEGYSVEYFESDDYSDEMRVWRDAFLELFYSEYSALHGSASLHYEVDLGKVDYLHHIMEIIKPTELLP